MSNLAQAFVKRRVWWSVVIVYIAKLVRANELIGKSSKSLRTYVLIHREKKDEKTTVGGESKKKKNDAQPSSRIDLPDKKYILQGYMFDRTPFVSKKPPQKSLYVQYIFVQYIH